jgi:glutamate/tyrosine decarboxylase-like PLP-dependent enzyme
MRASLPEKGLARTAILDHLTELKRGDIAWAQGRAPIYVFKGDDAVASVAREAFVEYFSENALGAKRAFPSIKQMEENIVSIGLSLINAPEDAAGYFTTGGSESIIGAVKACRNWSRARRGRSDERFNMVLPESGHPAFTKAGDLMDIEVRRVPVGVDLVPPAVSVTVPRDFSIRAGLETTTVTPGTTAPDASVTVPATAAWAKAAAGKARSHTLIRNAFIARDVAS